MESRVPPLVLVAAGAALMWLIARGLPALQIETPGLAGIAFVLLALGAAVCLAGFAAFRRARTTVNPLRPGAASTLVVTGIYTRTRNPMYLGFAFLLLGWAVLLANPLNLLVIAAFVASMNRFQIPREERALRSLFGADFDAYCARVRRWL